MDRDSYSVLMDLVVYEHLLRRVHESTVRVGVQEYKATSGTGRYPDYLLVTPRDLDLLALRFKVPAAGG